MFVELGLQTIHEETASFIRRGYPLSCFDEAVMNLHKIGVLTVVHLILGLPGETDDMMLESVRYLNHLPIHGVKFSMLHILKNTIWSIIMRNIPLMCLLWSLMSI